MKKKIFSLFLLFLFAPVLLTSCKSENEITVAEVTHSIFYAPFYVAQNKGFFEDEGLSKNNYNSWCR